MKRLPKEDYDTLVGACDVGMIFLDHRITIPNFPSRLLSYMQTRLPVLAVTDNATDVGSIIADGEYGWWIESNEANRFNQIALEIIKDDIVCKGNNGFEELCRSFSVGKSCQKVIGKDDV